MITLRNIPLSQIPSLELPTNKIQHEEDVQTWRQSQSYNDLLLFLHRLNEAVVGISLPRPSNPPSQAISSMIDLLETLDKWIDEIPPLESPQRFGNLSFRTWGKRLEEESDALLTNLLPSPDYNALVPHLKPYLLTSFGSFVRMDYGTGHETSFAILLLCLTLTRFFSSDIEEERDLVFIVFIRYLQLCWRLQDVYRLEPAGSHGVWGLDDSHFLGYIFGSGQLRDQTSTIPVSAVLHPPLPPTNLYFISIMRIHEVKHGPFHEHSSQLHSIAVGVPNWAKVNSGLFKMYEAEVLGKRVVVQHIPLGGLLAWNDSSSPPQHATSSTQRNSIGVTYPIPSDISSVSTASSVTTQAPWARGISSSTTTTPNSSESLLGSMSMLPPLSTKTRPTRDETGGPHGHQPAR